VARRIDFYDDPDAPPASSLVPSVNVVVTSNGEVRQEFSIVVTAHATGGEPTRSQESSEVRWVRPDDLGGYPMDRSMRLRLGHYLQGRAAPYLG
jgi:hypothetical protein